jgi:predicted DNA repair protein MutK
MLWVGGGIVLHGLEELHVLESIPHAIHDAAHAIGESLGMMGGIAEWIANAIGAAIAGFVLGTPIALGVMAWHRRKRHADQAHHGA